MFSDDDLDKVQKMPVDFIVLDEYGNYADLDKVQKMPVDFIVLDEYGNYADLDSGVPFHIAEDKGNHSLEFDVRLLALLRVAMPEVWERIRVEVETRAA